MSVETVATARPTVAAAAVTADAAAAEAAASPDAAAAACCHASFEMEGVYERRVRWVDTRGDLADGGGLLLCFDVRGTSDVGILVTDDAEVTDTRQHEVGGPSRDGHSHSHGASADAHHQQQQSSSPADASAAASSATSPAYHVRFANYQNTKTILEKRGETHPLHQVKHAKILNPKRFVSLWLNINIDRVRRRASFSCGFGAPSRTTALLSHLDCELACAVTRIGFTTWSQPIEVRNLRVVSPPLPCVDVWTMSPPCVPLLTPPSTPAMMALDPGPLPRSSSSCSSGTTSAGSFDALTSVAGAEVEVEAGSVVVFGGFSSEEDEDGAAVAAPRVLVRVGDTAFDCDALVLLASSGFFRDVGVGGGGGAAVVVAAAASGPVAADGSAPGASYAVSGSGREVAFTVPAAGSRGGGGGLTPASFAAWYRYVSGDAAATGSALPRDVCALLRTPLTAGQGAFKAGQVAALMEACACGTLCDLRLGCEDAAAALAAAEQKTTTFRPGTGGALAHAVEACGGGNPVRAKALRIAASSAKNPLSAGWKLFSGRPRLLCDATQVHARPFVVVGLVGGRLAPTHYELSHCEAEDSIRGWDLLARTGGDEAAKWVLLDERTDQHALSRPYTPALFSLPKQEGVAAYAEFKLVRTDGVDRMTLGSIEFYGVLTEDAPPPSPAE